MKKTAKLTLTVNIDVELPKGTNYDYAELAEAFGELISEMATKGFGDDLTRVAAQMKVELKEWKEVEEKDTPVKPPFKTSSNSPFKTSGHELPN